MFRTPKEKAYYSERAGYIKTILRVKGYRILYWKDPK